MLSEGDVLFNAVDAEVLSAALSVQAANPAKTVAMVSVVSECFKVSKMSEYHPIVAAILRQSFLGASLW